MGYFWLLYDNRQFAANQTQLIIIIIITITITITITIIIIMIIIIIIIILFKCHVTLALKANWGHRTEIKEILQMMMNENDDAQFYMT
jgi:heme/copper-type cytochrome/quinol oxidase subunit 2